MNQYYQERDSEFIEYTTLYVLRSILVEHGFPFISEEVLRPALKAFYANSQAHWHPEADAGATLEVLTKRGYRLGLVSNASDDEDVQTLIDKGGFRPFFEVIITSAALGIRKPNPKIFLHVLERLGVPPTRAAMVGDNLGADILGARNAGIYSVWITRRAETAANRDHEDTIIPDAAIAALSEIPELLKELEAQG
jgi:HAD superfamily hydrolase (TIGR01549 family)